MTLPIAPSFCARCGNPVTAGAHFCTVCGDDVSGQQGSLATEQFVATPARAGGADGMWQEQEHLLREATIGEYDILGELGRGGMAAVYLAHEMALDRKVAIKVMSPALVHGDGMVERFKREARTAASLSHPNIIPVYAVRETDELLYFVMKFISGRPLDSVLKELGPLPIPMIQMILQAVGGAFGYAHRRGIIHRDIKPANIMIDDEGWAVVTDFGIAKVSQAEGLTMTGMTVGTPTYMSPEQCMAQDVTGASDQYSLGIVAYEMITGRPPFAGGSMMAIMYGHFNDPPPPIEVARPDCPDELRLAVLRMLAKDPAERWPSMEAANEAIGAPPPKSDDVMRSQLIELAKKSENTKLLKRLSTPVSPTPIPKRTKPGTAIPSPRTAPGIQPRSGGPRPGVTAASAATVITKGAVAPKSSSKGLLMGGVGAVAVAVALAVWQPWKSPGPADPGVVALAPADSGKPAPSTELPPAQTAVDSSVPAGTNGESAATPPAADPPASPVDPAQLRRERRAYDGALTTATLARQRAVKAGATGPELSPADNLRRQAEQLAGGGNPANAMRQVTEAATAYGVAENIARLRLAQQQAAADPARMHPSTPPETIPAADPIRKPATEPAATVPAPVLTQAPAPAPVTAPVDERPAVEVVLREYARALSASDLQAMQTAFPGMSTQVRQAWEEFFKQKYSLDTSRWKLIETEVTGGTATVRIGGVSIQRDKKGKQSEAPPPRTAVLDKIGSGWRITSIH
ncbi:MAG: protein kinase [Gemmatimonadales bacterium]